MTTIDAPAPSRPPSDGKSPRPARAVVRQLAPVEARRFATHPVIWIALALGTWMTLADLLSLRLVLPRESINVQFVTLPVGAAALFVAHLATTRPRRDDVTEVLEPAVHGADTRILALLIAALTPATLTAGLVAALLGGMAALGAIGPVMWAEAAVPPAVVAGGGILGVLLGRVAPWRLAPLFALVALVAFQFFLAPGSPGSASPVALFSPVIEAATGRPDPTALLRPAAAHLAYVVGAVVLLAALTRLTTRVTVLRLAAGVVAVAVTATAAVAQLRPPSDDEVDALLDRVGTPIDAGECVDEATDLTVCALPTFVDWRGDWVEMAQDVRQPLVDRGIDPGPLTIAQRSDPGQAAYELSRWYDRDEVEADPRMVAAWETSEGSPRGNILVTADWLRGSADVDPSRFALALHVAREVTGLPGGFVEVEDEGDTGEVVTALRPCVPAGEARVPVTLWLAAQSHPTVEGALREDAVEQPYPGGSDDDADPADVGRNPWLEVWSPSIVSSSPWWSQTGVHVALQMLDRPEAEVLAAVTDDWDRWIDPATPLSDLVDELDLTMPPHADEVEAAGQAGDPEAVDCS